MSVDPPANVHNVSALTDWLSAQDAELGLALTRPGVRIAVDKTFTGQGAAIDRESEVAFMSPLSGG